MRRAIIHLVIALMFATAAYAEVVTVEAPKATVRAAAGPYQKVLTEIPSGTKLEVLEREPGWIKVRLPDKTVGYVSEAVLSKKSKPSEKRLAGEKGVGQAASSEVMAATKGVAEESEFVKKYAERHNLSTETLMSMVETPYTQDELKRFRTPLKRHAQKRSRSDAAFEGNDREMGAAVALRIASVGIYPDPAVRKYVALVGAMVVEHTQLAREKFVFIVLDSETPNSFAAPGGYVFITSGALLAMSTEAELAGVLSHEVAHITERHGMKELAKQRPRIQNKKMMDEMDKEIDKLGMEKPDAEVVADLDAITDDMYEYIISGRKVEDEDAADALGTRLLYETGYRADGLRKFIEKLPMLEGKAAKSHSSASDRIRNIDNAIREGELSMNGKPTLEDRFKQSVPR